MNGIINVYKEKGFTSHDVVAKMRGILKMKKIGHTGTLDPEAEGVLPICVGKATKLVDLITDKDKTYETVLKLGVVTDTQDLTGTVLKTNEVNVSYQEIENAVKHFIGEYQQLPPMYSAIKVNGKKLYELARQGKEIERSRRSVVIHDIRIKDYNCEEHEVTMSVDCGKGTYIRTLLHDIGERLRCGGAMKSLLRTKVGSFELQNALKLTEIETLVRSEKLEEHMIMIEDMFKAYPKAIVKAEYHKLIYNGNSFQPEHIEGYSNEGNSNKDFMEDETKLNKISFDTTEAEDFTTAVNNMEAFTSYEMFRVYDADNNFIGIYRFNIDEDIFRPVKMFLS
ncbi:tRNA pseudouridine(55) synthase TruB [Mobilitalea sibirica]|uniref:tRNA pseudouridine synthase B n=1 Tax=Mobilitalea sibirica TaxID=1462919 RepID=A0A8J7HC01_9FIRM|nr:tRNA pseudouridine(55) synthase TruB [Mobilitalea sibirica]